MKMQWTSTKSLFLSRILTKVVLILAVGALFAFPICTEWYDTVSGKEAIHTVLNICLYLSDAFGIIAVCALDGLLRNVAAQELFVEANVKYLRVISWCCFAVAVVFFALTFWRLLAFMVTFIAAFCGLILRVMKNLFAVAVVLREENDYTI